MQLKLYKFKRAIAITATASVNFAVFSEEAYGRTAGYFKDAVRRFSEGSTSGRYAATADLFRILEILSSEGEPPPQKEAIAAYFRLHALDSDFSVEEAARALFLSPNGLRKAVKRHFGTSPKAYADAIRMQRARELLCTGYFSVREVAEQCGFTDAKNFSTAFKKHFGISPSYVGKAEKL